MPFVLLLFQNEVSLTFATTNVTRREVSPHPTLSEETFGLQETYRDGSPDHTSYRKNETRNTDNGQLYKVGLPGHLVVCVVEVVEECE